MVPKIVSLILFTLGSPIIDWAYRYDRLVGNLAAILFVFLWYYSFKSSIDELAKDIIAYPYQMAGLAAVLGIFFFIARRKIVFLQNGNPSDVGAAALGSYNAPAASPEFIRIALVGLLLFAAASVLVPYATKQIGETSGEAFKKLQSDVAAVEHPGTE